MHCMRCSQNALRALPLAAPGGSGGCRPQALRLAGNFARVRRAGGAGSGLRPGGQRRTFVSDADVAQARTYCANQLREGDYDAYLVRHYLPPGVRDAYLALRALNLELARLPETVSNPTIGHMRVQFWKDAIDQTFDGRPPREPVSLLLYAALAALAARAERASSAAAAVGAAAGVQPPARPEYSAIRFWLQRLVSARAQRLDDRPFADLAALEAYAETTYATLLYVTLAMLPLRSVHVDHLASHIGKACGIAAVLRGIPVLAGQRRPTAGTAVAAAPPVLLLPLDVMADAGLREEDVYRLGPDAPGLSDAVFHVATRANDHLITAREMLKNLRAGQDPGHAYEHAGEEGHAAQDDEAASSSSGTADKGQQRDLHLGFNVLLEAVPVQDYLSRLEEANFDPFRTKRSWKLPWSLYWAQRRKTI